MSDFEQLVQHLQVLERKHGMMRFEIGFGLALTLIAQLQLALRHPGNNGASASDARAFLDEMIARLDANSPGIGRILKQGDDPSRDVPRGG